MMISQKMADRLNVQVNHEFLNAMSYMAVAYWFEAQGLKVFAKYFYKQSDEERGHAQKIAQYLIDQGSEVKLTEVEKPKVAFKNAKEVVEHFVELEVKTTKMVHEIVAMAQAENDFATRNFIDWKVAEQVEEVATANELANMVKHAETFGQLLVLEGRVYLMIEGKA